MIYWISFILAYIWIKIFLPTKVIGKKNLPKSNFVGVCNHYSNYDAVILNINVRRFYYLSKKELFKNKFLSWFFYHIGMYPIDRGHNDIGAIKYSLKEIKKGKSFMMFPEGTRNKSDDIEHMVEIKQGAIMIAGKTGKQIVPMLIDRPPKLFRRTRIIVGEPITLVGENLSKLTKEEMEQNSHILEERLTELRGMLNNSTNKKNHKNKLKNK